MISTGELYSIYLQHPVVCTDTRSLTPGCIFFALKGPSFNGNQFAGQALKAGAAYAVVDDPQVVQDSRFLLVEDVLTALQHLARHHRRELKLPVLAITGSNGKTTTKELVRAVLEKKFNVYATRGNLNNHIGVPLTLLALHRDVEFAVVEMGANHQGEIASYCTIAEPDFGLITNVGKAHLEGFGGFAGVKKGKGELYAYLSGRGGKVFLNAANPHLAEMVQERQPLDVVTYGTATGDCSGTLLAEQPFLKIGWRCGSCHGEIQTQLVGAYNVENVLSAVAIGNHFGVTPEAIDAAIAAYVPDNSRSQVVKRGSNTVILDAYNANPTSMEAAILNLSAMTGANKIVCIGDMAELGGESEREHERIVRLLQSSGFAKVILVGPHFGKFASALECLHFADSAAAATWVKDNPFENSTVLIKGSRSSRMERVLESM